MSLFAVTIAGVPSPASTGVIEDLRNRFNDGYVFRASTGRISRRPTLTDYSGNGIDHVLDAACNALFGSTKRPNSFCRHPQHACALAGGAGNRNCSKSENESCYLRRPDFLVIFFQSGINEEALLASLHFCAFIVRIPEALFGKRKQTLEFVIENLRVIKGKIQQIRQEIASKNSPLLLPPNNFQGKDIIDLLKSHESEDLLRRVRTFRAKHFAKDEHGYKARKDRLLFKPSEAGGDHGRPGPQERAAFALSRHHRLGCVYSEALHYDVTRLDERNFDGTIEFTCRSGGVDRPRGKKHFNILVDDCFRKGKAPDVL